MYYNMYSTQDWNPVNIFKSFILGLSLLLAPTLGNAQNKVQINPITTGFRSMQQYNADLIAIQSAMNNTLSRDGTTPNQMHAPLDMNGFPIINASGSVLPSI